VDIFPRIALPKDSSGYIQSFSIDNEEEYKKFFIKHGFVVIDGILSTEEVSNTVTEIWNQLETKPQNPLSEAPLIDRNDPSTWSNSSWPKDIRALGLLGSNIALGKYTWLNRQNPKVYKVFCDLLGRKDLWSSVDRHGIMRPTVQVPTGKLPENPSRRDAIAPPDWEGGFEDHENWRSASFWTHWDLNPWHWTGAAKGLEYEFMDFITENNGSKNMGDPKIQGLIALSDSNDDDGGFCCVPGFHKFLKEWAEKTVNTDFCEESINRYDYVNVPKGDPLHDALQKITCREGSLIVWNSQLPHCNFPNHSNKFRINQYLKMFPAQPNGKGVSYRKQILAEIFQKGKRRSD